MKAMGFGLALFVRRDRTVRLAVAPSLVFVALLTLAGDVVRHWPSEPTVSLAVGGPRDGDPVSLATGLYVRTSNDFIVIGTPPLHFARVYMSTDSRALPFGIGTTHSYDYFMTGDLSAITVITDERSRIPYVRIDGGTGREGARYEHRTSPSRFYGSTLIEQQDETGRQLSLVRDDLGRLVKIEAPNGNWLQLHHDGNKRVTRGWDSTGRSMQYEYDAGGRLGRAVASTGEVQTYEYDAFHRVTRMTERDGMIITNTYDAASRTTGQVVAFPPDAPGSVPPAPLTFGFRYGTSGTRITDVEVTRSDGTVRRLTLNTVGYTLVEVQTTPDGVATTITYARNPATNVVSSLEVVCTDPSGATMRLRVNIPSERHADALADVLACQCRMSLSSENAL